MRQALKPGARRAGPGRRDPGESPRRGHGGSRRSPTTRTWIRRNPGRGSSGAGAAVTASRCGSQRCRRPAGAIAEDDPLAGLPAEGTVINGELQTLRRMLETQLAALAWNDLTRRAPLATEMLRELTRLGFAQDVVAKVADALPASLDFTRARRLAIARLADSLEVTGDRWCDAWWRRRAGRADRRRQDHRYRAPRAHAG